MMQFSPSIPAKDSGRFQVLYLVLGQKQNSNKYMLDSHPDWIQIYHFKMNLGECLEQENETGNSEWVSPKAHASMCISWMILKLKTSLLKCHLVMASSPQTNHMNSVSQSFWECVHLNNFNCSGWQNGSSGFQDWQPEFNPGICLKVKVTRCGSLLHTQHIR